MISTADAPSVICDELPAVTRPPSSSDRNDGLSVASDSSVRLPQPFVGGHRSAVGADAPAGSPARSGPRLSPGAASRWLRTPNASSSSRVMLPLVGDQLGGDALRHEPALVGVASADARPERIAELAVGHRRSHRHAGHHLDAGRDDDVVGAGDHALGGEVGGLLARSALAVDRRAGHRVRASRPRARRCGRRSPPARRPASRTPCTTSSTMPGSRPLRSTTAFSVSAARSTGCHSFSLPLRLPRGVRTASTRTAEVIGPVFYSRPTVAKPCEPAVMQAGADVTEAFSGRTRRSTTPAVRRRRRRPPRRRRPRSHPASRSMSHLLCA